MPGGIHVDDVAMVVHYDLPASDKDYVHRSGRTGRAGATGIVVTMVMEDQQQDARAIQRSLGLPSGSTPMDINALHTPAAAPQRDRRTTRNRSGTTRTHDAGRDNNGRDDQSRSKGRRPSDAPRGGARPPTRRSRTRSRTSR